LRSRGNAATPGTMATVATSWPMITFWSSPSSRTVFRSPSFPSGLSGNPGPVGHNLQHQVLVDGDALLLALLLPLLGDLLGACRGAASRDRGIWRLLEMLLARSPPPFAHKTDSISLFNASMSGGRLSAEIRAREPASSMTSDRLVREEAAGDVPVGEFGGSLHGLVRENGLVMSSYLPRMPLRIRMCPPPRALQSSPTGNGGRGRCPSRCTCGTRSAWSPPMHCSSPRESAGLKMLEASIAPSAAPAPTMVCNSSIKDDDVLGTFDLVHHRLDAFLKLAPGISCRHPSARRSSVMTFLSSRISGTTPVASPAPVPRRSRSCPRPPPR